MNKTLGNIIMQVLSTPLVDAAVTKYPYVPT